MKIGHHIFELKLIAQGPRSDPRAEKIAAAKQFAGEAGLSVAWDTTANYLAEQMRYDYFSRISAEELASHIAQVSSMPRGSDAEVRTRSADGRTLTYFVPNPSGKLEDIVLRIQNQDLSVKRAPLYTTADGKLGIFQFDVGTQKPADLTLAELQSKVQTFRNAVTNTRLGVGRESHKVTEAEVDAFLKSLSHTYLEEAGQDRLVRHFMLYIRVMRQDRDSIVGIEPSTVRNDSRITLVARNIPQTGFLLNVVRVLEHYRLDLRDVFVETLENDVMTHVRHELRNLIGERDTVARLIEIVGDRGVSDAQRALARDAILSWGERDFVASLLKDLTSGDQRLQNDARDALQNIGTEAQERAQIITFYVVKKETGMPLNEKRDRKAIVELSEDLEAVKWFAGQEFYDTRLNGSVWRPRQLSLLWGMGTFVDEMFCYRYPDVDRPNWTSVRDTLLRNPNLTRTLVHLFEARFDPDLQVAHNDPEPNVTARMLAFNKLYSGLQTDQDRQVFGTAIAFVNAIQRTNYFGPTSSLAFQLNPNFVRTLGLPEADFPETPFGVFYVVANGVRGYHNRFTDVARGGVRAKRSSTPEAYSGNSRKAYWEGYRLAFTQDFKNPIGELPEGGSKGIMVLSPDANPIAAGDRFLDGLLDLMLGTDTTLYLGPDVATANLMDRWAERARRRGHPHWLTMTSSKRPDFMGISHDQFGMTTVTVDRFIELALERRGMAYHDATVVVTGGPNGDVAGNQLRFSIRAGAKVKAVFDSKAFIYDPDGLDGTELLRLADADAKVTEYDRAKFGPRTVVMRHSAVGQKVTLPDERELTGTGAEIANNLFFEIDADILVPGDVRTSVINESNVHRLIRPDGTPKIKFISEGGNLFLTQGARRILEDAGVEVYKDESANQGGVSSSSREIQLGFMVDPDEFGEIRDEYIAGILAANRRRVDEQFNLMWRVRDEAARKYQADGGTGPKPDKMYLSEISMMNGRALRTVRNRILRLIVEQGGLPDDPLMNAVVRSHVLPVVIRRFGEDRIRRLPPKYRAAIVAMTLATSIVHREGLDVVDRADSITWDQVLTEARQLTTA